MISFGPVPSRRLRRSLGINNISSLKTCTYSCIYCQVGLTKIFSQTRKSFYDPWIIFHEVQNHLSSLQKEDLPDYLTFVPNGEPTLDKHLGDSIRLLKSLGYPIAVITNASLLRDPAVRSDLLQADWVSVKVDAGNQTTWKKINRPMHFIDFEEYKDGLRKFSKEYNGKLVTETMLIKDINDQQQELVQTSRLVAELQPTTAYLAIPTRPPALRWITGANEETTNAAYQLFVAEGLNPELILGYEGTNIGFTGNAMEDIVNICTVHPIRGMLWQNFCQRIRPTQQFSAFF